MQDDPRDPDVPTGLPEDEPEEQPLGVPDSDPGAGSMPGIPDGGEPPSAG
jgi:hypothetical protein